MPSSSAIRLLVFMIVTAVLGFARHHLLTLFAFAKGVLLVCDAWFDVLTARRGDFAVSVLIAALGELPLAGVLIGGALRIARLQIPQTAGHGGRSGVSARGWGAPETVTATNLDELNKDYDAIENEIGYRTVPGPGSSGRLRRGVITALLVTALALLINRRLPT
jgi:hypothetical protein